MLVYILMNHNGEQYEDYEEWIVDIYSNKEMCEEEMNKLNNPQPPVIIPEEEWEYSSEDPYTHTYEYYVSYIWDEWYRHAQGHAWIIEKELK